MATLRDDALKRLSRSKLIRLTNPDVTRPDNIDEERLESAVADAEAAFRDNAEKVYDSTDARHVRIAVRLLEIELMSYSVSWGKAGEKSRELAQNDARKLRGTQARSRQALQSGNASDTTAPIIGDDFLK